MHSLLYLAESLHATIMIRAFNRQGDLDPSIVAMLISAACEVLIDIVNTVALFTGLRRLKTGWRRTDRLVGRVIHWTVETQLPPLIVSVMMI
jgi:hypothetical protein